MSSVLLGSLIVAASLGATIYWEAQSFVRPDLAETAPHLTMPGAVRATPALDPADAAQGWMATALERPLFRENRRPENELADVAQNSSGPARLAGVMTGPFGNRAIFMLTADDAKPITVKLGGHINDLVIRSIEPGRVVVEAGDGLRTLTPSFAEKGAPAATLTKKTNSTLGVIRNGKGSSFEG